MTQSRDRQGGPSRPSGASGSQDPSGGAARCGSRERAAARARSAGAAPQPRRGPRTASDAGGSSSAKAARTPTVRGGAARTGAPRTATPRTGAARGGTARTGATRDGSTVPLGKTGSKTSSKTNGKAGGTRRSGTTRGSGTRPAAPRPSTAGRPAGSGPVRPVRFGVGHPRRRVRAMFIAILFVFSLFGAQLLRIQALDASAMAKQALGSRLHTAVVPALRGSITDSRGVVLAASIERFDIVVNQQAVPQYVKTVQHGDTRTRETVGVAGAAADLAPLLGMTVPEVTDKLTGNRAFNYVAKGITPLTWRKIKALGINGIDAEATSKRSYPTSTTAASLVGFVGADGRPGGGLELLLDKQLQGTPGMTSYEQSRDGRVIPTDSEHSTPAVSGRDVRLTINSDLQWFAQNAISAKVKETDALSGTVTVTDVKTGHLLAVASYPTFDPNHLASASGNLDNRAFDEVYEPGSTGKVITAAAALEEGVATPDTPVTVPNTLKRAGTVFHDSHDHPTEHLTFAQVLAQSSNIGTMLVGEKLSPDTMYSYQRKFGLGEKSGIGFPGESPGLVAKPSDWSGSQRYTMMFGQGLSLNAIQAAGVFQTVANGGVRMPPTLVAGTENADGTSTAAPTPKGKRVVSPEVAKQVREMLEGVVGKEGTAPEAKIPGYRVAGKTGTADRYDDKTGGYSGKTASFIGFAPADKPEHVIGVTVQRPGKSYYGGVVAGPVFHDVMTYALQELKIPPTAATTPPTIKLKTTER